MKKKLLGVLFVLGLLLALPSVVSFAETKNGTCGATGNVGSVKWVLDDNGTLTISGSGDMANYNLIMPLAPWYVYRATIKTVVIEKGVTRIGNSAFQNCTKLTSVTIPNSVISIEKYAFLNCTNRTNVYYTGTKTEWGNVNGKDRLNSATLHYHCGATADDNAYWALVGGTLTISGSGDMANYTNADEVQWKDSVADIKNVVIGNGVTNVGAYAFNGCENLTSVVIPTGVTQIGDNAFNDCNKLANVYYNGTKAQWDGLTKGSGNAYLTNATLHYHCGATADDNVYWALVGDTLTISGSGAMEGYDKSTNKAPWNDSIATIKTVVIENGVTNVGDYAFCNCTNLTSVTIPDSVESIGTGTFWGCSNLQSVTIPKKVTSIGSSTFNSCANLTSVTIPDKVTSIGVAAFYGCTSLESVVIPKSVTSIGISAFLNCTNLTDVYYTGTKTQWDNGLDKGSGNDSLTNATLYYNFVKGGTCGAVSNADNVKWVLDGYGTLTIVGSGDMKDYAANEVPWYDSIKDIKNVKIGYGVINIGDNAFNGCTSLMSVSIPEGVTQIGDNAFNGCTSLMSVSIPEGVTQIGDNAFNGCTSLTSVTIPDSVTSIGNYAFNGCTNLDAIYIPEGYSVGTSAIPDVASQINYRVEHTTKNKGIDDEKVVVITSATKSITLNCDSMGNGYYIIKNEAGDSVTLSDVCKPNDDTITHTGYSMRRRKKINAENHVYGCVAGRERRCIDCGAKQTCTGNPSEVKSGNLTYNCYTCGDGIKVVELNLAAA